MAKSLPYEALATPSPGSDHATTGRSPRCAAVVRCTVDPSDGHRTLISGRMSEVCDTLDRLIARQARQTLPAQAPAMAPGSSHPVNHGIPPKGRLGHHRAP